MTAGKLMIVYVVIILVIGVGWVKNLIKLAECDFASPYKTEVIRVISIFPIVGAVTGWMTIGEEHDSQ